MSETPVSLRMRSALTIAGSDSSGGAGIQADIKTITLCGVYASSAITALTAQNTRGVRAIEPVGLQMLERQIDAVFEDIRPDAVKVGMLPTAESVRIVAERLRHHGATHVVVDPVMVSTSKAALVSDGAIEAMESELFVLAELVTPNIDEAERLSGLTIRTESDMARAACLLQERWGCSVLVKGGHAAGNATDILCHGGSSTAFQGTRVDNPNTHGTGCTLSSAIAAHLAKGYPLDEAIGRAKEYVARALAAMLDLGQGSGPLHHAFDLTSTFAE